MKTIGIVFNPEKEYNFRLVNKFLKVLTKSFNVSIEKTSDDLLSKIDITNITIRNTIGKSDLIFIFGGDGTLLNTCRKYVKHDPIFMGINSGKLGFLTEVEVSELNEIANSIGNGYKIIERSLLEVKVKNGEKTISSPALNEIVIAHRKNDLRMLSIRVFVDEKYLTTFVGDGVIVATATGSTGYSVSAFGPILEPTLNVGAILSLNPHTLSNRPFVYDIEKQVTLEVTTDIHNTAIFVDGQRTIKLSDNSIISVSRYLHKARFIDLEKHDFFSKLRAKLNWRGYIKK